MRAPEWKSTQQSFNLSDLAVEDALYDSATMRRLADLGREPVPDETAICKFRHLFSNKT